MTDREDRETAAKSPEALREMIAEMRRASGVFYRTVQQIDVHPFLEFTGLMNEYIELCEGAIARGVDFTETSVHSGQATLGMEAHHVRYLSEKLECIYGKSLADFLESTRQCCQCGATGRVQSKYMSVLDATLCPSFVPITWKCAGCRGHVCFNCTLTQPGSVPLEFEEDTLCSEACKVKLARRRAVEKERLR